MVSCIAYGCTNRTSKKTRGITFHCFPKNEAQKELWIKAVQRKDWYPSSYSRICSKHFLESMIDRTSLTNVRLRENACPTIFKFSPSNLKQDNIKKPRKHPTPQCCTGAKNEKSKVESAVNLKSKKNVRLVLNDKTLSSYEIKISTSPFSKAKRERTIDKLKEVISTKEEKIKLLQRKTNSFSKCKPQGTKTVQKNCIGSSKICSKQHPKKIIDKILVPSVKQEEDPATSISDCTPCSSTQVKIKVEKPWEEGYNSCVSEKVTENTQVIIQDVRSLASCENMKNSSQESFVVAKKEPESTKTSRFQDPIELDKRDQIFGKLIACELRALRENRELYFQAKQSILDVLGEVHLKQKAPS